MRPSRRTKRGECSKRTLHPSKACRQRREPSPEEDPSCRSNGRTHNICHARASPLAHLRYLLLQCSRASMANQDRQAVCGSVAITAVLDIQDGHATQVDLSPSQPQPRMELQQVLAACTPLISQMASMKLLPSHVSAHHGSRPAACARASASFVLHDKKGVADCDELVCRVIGACF